LKIEPHTSLAPKECVVLFEILIRFSKDYLRKSIFNSFERATQALGDKMEI